MNNWLRNNNEEIEEYVRSQDIILVDREKSIRTLLTILKMSFPQKQTLSILDLGCGDGSITKLISNQHPENNYTLLDGSTSMLAKARENNSGKDFTYIESTFEELLHQQNEGHIYDFIFSSMAIHHLEHSQKKALYNKIHTLLKSDGLLLNYDITLPSSKSTEAIQFKLWHNEVQANSVNTNDPKLLEKYLQIPAIYKANSENRPSTMQSQTAMLSEIGFCDVECYFKNGLFALFGGKKL